MHVRIGENVAAHFDLNYSICWSRNWQVPTYVHA